jgi:hypothetical protein
VSRPFLPRVQVAQWKKNGAGAEKKGPREAEVHKNFSTGLEQELLLKNSVNHKNPQGSVLCRKSGFPKEKGKKKKKKILQGQAARLLRHLLDTGDGRWRPCCVPCLPAGRCGCVLRPSVHSLDPCRTQRRSEQSLLQVLGTGHLNDGKWVRTLPGPVDPEGPCPAPL